MYTDGQGSRVEGLAARHVIDVPAICGTKIRVVRLVVTCGDCMNGLISPKTQQLGCAKFQEDAS